MTNFLRIFIFSFLLIVNSVGNSTEREVLIGIIDNLSEVSLSTCNPFGTSFQEGINLAIEHNKNHLKNKNIEIKIKEFDYGSQSANVIKEANKAVKSDVLAILGYSCSKDALLAAPVHLDNRLPMITPSASAMRLADFKNYVHKGSFSNNYIGNNLANVAIRDLKAKTVTSVVALDCAYCKDLSESFKDAFLKQGGAKFNQIGVLLSDYDFDKIMSELKKQNPDAILVPNTEILSASIIKTIMKNGIIRPFLGGDGWGNIGKQFKSIIGDLKINGYTIAHWHPDLTDGLSKKFLYSYKSRYNRIPNDTTVLAYDAMSMMIKAIMDCKVYTREEIEKILNSIKEFTGVTGKYYYASPCSFPNKSLVLLK